jgi:hypothetical protein
MSNMEEMESIATDMLSTLDSMIDAVQGAMLELADTEVAH